MQVMPAQPKSAPANAGPANARRAARGPFTLDSMSRTTMRSPAGDAERGGSGRADEAKRPPHGQISCRTEQRQRKEAARAKTIGRHHQSRPRRRSQECRRDRQQQKRECLRSGKQAGFGVPGAKCEYGDHRNGRESDLLGRLGSEIRPGERNERSRQRRIGRRCRERFHCRIIDAWAGSVSPFSDMSFNTTVVPAQAGT
jgi:hypothetical protein